MFGLTHELCSREGRVGDDTLELVLWLFGIEEMWSCRKQSNWNISWNWKIVKFMIKDVKLILDNVFENVWIWIFRQNDILSFSTVKERKMITFVKVDLTEFLQEVRVYFCRSQSLLRTSLKKIHNISHISLLCQGMES